MKSPTRITGMCSLAASSHRCNPSDYRSPSLRPLVIFIMSRERSPDESRILDKTAWRQLGVRRSRPTQRMRPVPPNTPKTDTSSQFRAATPFPRAPPVSFRSTPASGASFSFSDIWNRLPARRLNGRFPGGDGEETLLRSGRTEIQREDDVVFFSMKSRREKKEGCR